MGTGFEQILDAAIDLLRRRGRISARALGREFGLDAPALADLTHELVDGQRVAREEAGVLLWDASQPAAAERRQLTVMFCDLVDSTRLARTLDPEDFRELVQRYQAECDRVVVALGGHVAQYLGDGILVYFGHPLAQEHDAERAVRAGLELVRAMSRLAPALRSRFGADVQLRVGIHTGLAVIGEVGHALRRETLALGETPHLAAHIQAAAEPGTVFVSEDTLRLLRGRFVSDDRGEQVLKNSGSSLRLARIVGEREPVDTSAGRSTLLEREAPWQQLLAAWRDASAGTGRVVSLHGAAGIGKTRLVDELRASVRAESGEVMVLRCSPFHRHSALHPFAQHIARRSGLDADSPSDEVGERLRSLLAAAGIESEDDLSLLAELVAPGSAHAATATKLPPVELMRATQDLLLRWITAASADAPLLLVCEDLHWADSSTLALLERLIRATHAPARGTMILLTARSGFAAPWTMPASAAMLVIDRLGPGSTARLVQQLAGARELPAALVQRIVDASDGVPLYAEEVTRAVLAAGASDGAAIEVPATLQASLLARLDRLGPARGLAQTAALLGREFSFELLAAVVDLPVARLGQALHQLVAADLLRRRGAPPQARYTFRHALLQSAAADSMLRATRMHSHRRIAEVLQARFPGAVEAEPEIAAHHLAEAGESRRAIALWERAGERALGRSAVTEAVAHFDAALSLLDAVHDREERERLELGLRVPRAGALRALCGVAAPATGEAYEQAVGLARRLGEDQRLIPCLNGLYAYHMVRGQCDAALAPAQELLQVAHRRGDAVYEMIGHRAVGAVAFHVGQPLRAQEHLRRALALYVPARDAQLALTLGIDHKVSACNFLALTCLVLDDADEAMSLQRDGLARAESLAHAHSVAQALVFGCLLLALRGDWDELRDWSQRTCALAGERGFALMDAGGRFFRACAIAFDGDAEAGLAQMHEGAQAWWKTGARNYRTFAEMLLARAHAQLGQHDAAAALLREAHAGIAATGERWVEPELWRVEALLLRERPDADAGSIEARLQRALSLAQGQQARRWERLAAASLAAARAAATRPPAAS